MKLRYIVIGDQDQLRKVSRKALEAVWEGRRPAHTLGCSAPNEIRLVSVVCDKKLLPRKIFLLRLPLTDGMFTVGDYLTLQAFSRSDCVTPQEVIEHHAAGWPPDFFEQLAVLMDVPLKSVAVPFGIGGPLLVAAALRVTPQQALQYLK